MMQTLLPFFIMAPLAAAFLITAFGRFIPGLHKTLAVVTTLGLTGLAAWLLCWKGAGPETYYIGGWDVREGWTIGITLVWDGLSSLILLISSTIALFSCIYALSYTRPYTAEINFYALFCLMFGGMNGVVLTGDIFNLYVFLEVAVIASYALVAFGTEKHELEASFKYQVLGGTASILILLGIGMLYWQTHTLNIADIGTSLSSPGQGGFLIFTQVILLAGFGLKAALIPFHAWLPDAHASAPAPISSMLSGVLIKAIGVYVILRLFFNVFLISYDLGLIILVIGTLSMILGAMLAIYQDDMKRMLAYSSISQIGFIVTSFGMVFLLIERGADERLVFLAAFGGLFHMINHAVFKGLMFLNAGTIEYLTGTRELSRLGGLASKHPLTAATSLGGSLAISGIPPFNGFFSKLIIIIAAIQGGFYVVALIAVAASIITVAYFFRLMRNTFYGEERNNLSGKHSRVPLSMKLSLVVMLVLCLLLSSLVIPEIREVLINPAIEVITNPLSITPEISG